MPKTCYILAPEFRRLPLHLGALLACCESLPKPDVIVGCSAGAIAAAFSQPWTSANFQSRFETLKNLASKQIYTIPRSTEAGALMMAGASLLPFLVSNGKSGGKKLLVRGLGAGAALLAEWLFIKNFLNRTHVFSNEPLRKLLSDLLDFAAIFRSSIKLEIIAIDMRTGDEVVFSNFNEADQEKNRFVNAILASAGLPGRFPPTIIDDMILGDAGILRGTPLHRAQINGCDKVVVFLYTPAKEKRPAPETWIHSIVRASHITETEVTRLTFENYDLRQEFEKLPEVYVIRCEGKIPDIDMRKFNQVQLSESLEMGYSTIYRQLPAIKQFLNPR